MKILAVDSVGKPIVVTLIDDDKNYKKTLDISQNASEFLLTMVDNILTENNLSLKDIDFLAMNIGPGSFTGIRIAMSMFKGFMVNTNLKCAVVNSFELLSYNIKDEKFAVVIDSGTSDYYVMVKDGKFTSYHGYDIESIKKLAESMKIYSGIMLDGVNYELVKQNENAIIDCAKKKIENGELKNCFELEPLYVKKSQPEREYKQKFMKTLTIIKADKKYLADVVKLENENFTYDKYSEKQLLDDIELDRLLVALDKDKVVGYISFLESDMAEILKVCTDKDFRNLGIGEALINEVGKLTNKKLYLEVSENNPAKNFYAKLGFKLINVRKKYYADNSDALIMTKEN